MGGQLFIVKFRASLLGGQAGSSSGPDPHRWRELLDLSNFGGGQTGKQIFQIIERVDAEPPATTQQSVNHGAAFPSFGMANEHPIAFSKGRRPNRVFDFVVINFKNAVGDKLVQSRPSFQRVINRLSEQPLRQGLSPYQLHSPVQPIQYRLWADDFDRPA